METINEWLNTVDNIDHREKIRGVLNWVKDTFPALETVIKWNQPMFTDHGTFIIGFSVSKNHFAAGLEGEVIRHFEKEMTNRGQDFSKMIIRFNWTEEVDYDLLEKIIQFQIEDKKDCSTFWRK